MGLLKGPKDRGLRSGLPRLAINMTGRLVIVKPEPTCPAAAGAEFDQIQLTGQDITDSAGVPKGSFYNHFDSKEALAVWPCSVTPSAGGWRISPTPARPPGRPARPLRAVAGRD